MRPFAAFMLFVAFALACVPGAFAWTHGTYAAEAPFTATNTYYMAAASCSDSNNGTSPSTPWCTPNHSVQCGDVIIAAPGNYNGDFSTWGTVATCPSTTAGIDGAGGVYFAVLLCAGNLQTCNVNCATAACNPSTLGSGGGQSVSAGMNVGANNWAIEGFSLNGNGYAHRGFMAEACLTNTTVVHHIAFINDIAYNSGTGFATNDCAYSHNVPGNGVDEWAVVGTISQNANLDPVCVGTVDDAGPANNDNNAGTHIFLSGNFLMANAAALSNTLCVNSDIEGIILDTFDAHGYTGQTDVENNIVYASSWVGINIFQQTYNSSTESYSIHHNTFFGDMTCTPYLVGDSGEIYYNLTGNFPWTINTYDNIGRTNRSALVYGSGCTTPTGYHAYAMLTSGGTNPTFNTGGGGLQNIFYGTAGTCGGSSCDGGDNVIAYNGSPIGTNTYEDAAFANTTDLLTNWVGQPLCSGFSNVAACMGWNYASQTAVAATPVGDLTPTAVGTSGKGYQPPGPCASNALYPSYLKGIVYLQWNGSSLTENAGLVNKPCGM